MKSSILSTAIFCTFFSGAFAQKYYTTTLRKNNGQEVFQLDSADFISVISEPDAGSKLYNVQEFYKDKKPKLIGKSKNYKEIMFQGVVENFYPSGKKKELTTYVDGQKIGDSYEYYPNGKIYTHKKYVADKTTNGNGALLLDCRDSTGTVLATNGEGRFRTYGSDFSYVFEEGNIKDGLREGEWNGDNGNKEHNIKFTEQYSGGILKSGTSVYADDNKTYTYTSRYVDAEYPGGQKALNKYVMDHGKYPISLKINHIQGTVNLDFSVLTDGTLSDFKVTRSPDLALSEEAVRVIKSTPKWMPACNFGRPVQVAKSTPVIFGYNRSIDEYIVIDMDYISF